MSESSRRSRAEMVHCLVMDIVGYSRHSIDQQQRLARELRDAVRAAAEYQRALKDGELVTRDLGDGLALIFSRNPIAPVQCAVEVAADLRTRPHLPVRMGIHSGPITWDQDLTGQANVYGGGINLAQRVMEFGDAGHVLLSDRSATDLRQFEEWTASLSDLGEVELKHAERIHVWNLVTGEAGNATTPAGLQRAPAEAGPAAASNGKPEPAGGALAPNSPYYIERPADRKFLEAIRLRESIVLVRGARQIGKTSLLARGIRQARSQDCTVVYTDYQTFNAPQLTSADSFLQTLAYALSVKLHLDASPRDHWDPGLGANMNMDAFMENHVLGSLDRPLVWAMDEVDRLCASDFGSEVFGLFRSWHNRRAADPDGPWTSFTLAMAYATEVHLFITDLTQSPFNVGTRLTLEDFDQTQVEDLNRRYGEPLKSAAEVSSLYALVGGHPYLVRRGLDVIAGRDATLEELLAAGTDDEGPFQEHLRRLLLTLTRDKTLTDAVREMLHGRPCPSSESFFHLQTAGIVAGHSAHQARLRCRLYSDYLRRHLL